MKYFRVDGYHIPRHCKYGPRPNEGVLLPRDDWHRITDNVTGRVKKDHDDWHKPQEGAQPTKEKICPKLEKPARPDKIEEDESIDDPEAEKKKILSDARRVLYESQPCTKAIVSGLLLSEVLYERQKQIELKNHLRNVEEKKEADYAAKVKKLAEEFAEEKRREKISEKDKQRQLKEMLDKQMMDQRPKENNGSKQIEREQEDIRNMRIQMTKEEESERLEKVEKAKMCRRFLSTRPRDLAIQKEMELEEEEEDKIIKINNQFTSRFERGRKQELRKMIQNAVSVREYAAARLAEKKQAITDVEEARLEAAMREKEMEELERLEEKERRNREMHDELYEALEQAAEATKREAELRREGRRWEMVQRFKRDEENRAWVKSEKQRDRDIKTETFNMIKKQVEEKESRKIHEDVKEPRDEELPKYLEQALEYARKRGWPTAPILTAAEMMRKENCQL